MLVNEYRIIVLYHYSKKMCFMVLFCECPSILMHSVFSAEILKLFLGSTLSRTDVDIAGKIISVFFLNPFAIGFDKCSSAFSIGHLISSRLILRTIWYC